MHTDKQPWKKRKNPVWRRCGGERQCRACASDSLLRPHGPYWYAWRRRVGERRPDLFYLGSVEPTQEQIDKLNELDEKGLVGNVANKAIRRLVMSV